MGRAAGSYCVACSVKKLSGRISTPVVWAASKTFGCCGAGIQPRSHQPCTVDAFLCPSARAAALIPPNFAMIGRCGPMLFLRMAYVIRCVRTLVKRGMRTTGRAIIGHVNRR